MIHIPELLAPAGSYEALQAAVKGGAHAVYLGGNRFSARSGAKNFDTQALTEALNYAHLHDVRVYYAMNTMIKGEERLEALKDIDFAYGAGIDGIIIQDLGLVPDLKTYYQDLPIHGSTQLTIHSLDGVALLESLGFKRVVLARELSLEAIATIRAGTSMELEVFVHGALCYAYSGKCLMSRFQGGRSGNRGDCAQPCRHAYTLASGQQGYPLSLKDNMGLAHIEALKNIGVHALKIEGRMKSPHYVGAVTRIYRQHLEDPKRPLAADQAVLAQLFNRDGFTDGYLTHEHQAMVTTGDSGHTGVTVGVIKASHKKPNHYQVQVVLPIHVGDTLQVEGRRFLMDQAFNAGSHTLFLKSNDPLAKGTHLNRLMDQTLIKAIETDILEKDNRLQVNGYCTATIGAPITLAATYKDHTFKARGPLVVQATNQPMDAPILLDTLSKTGTLPMDFGVLEGTIDSDIFVSIKDLKTLKRDAILGLYEVLINPYKNRLTLKQQGLHPMPIHLKKHTASQETLTVLLRHPKHFDVVLEARCAIMVLDMAFLTDSLLEEMCQKAESFHQVLHLKLPTILRDKDRGAVLACVERLKPFLSGLVAGSYDTFWLAKSFGLPVGVDQDIPVYQPAHVTVLEGLGAVNYELSPELAFNELKAFSARQGLYTLYGHQMTMITAQCPKAVDTGCDARSNFYTFTDRKQAKILGYRDCQRCVNYLMHPNPTNHIDQIQRLRKLGIDHYKMAFFNEDVKTVASLLKGAMIT